VPSRRRTCTLDGNWLWMHNGLIRDFTRVQHELQLQVAD
jgi:hypothetical protein